jgi:hypothetical protein
VLATQCGLTVEETVQAAIDGSLERLGTDARSASGHIH